MTEKEATALLDAILEAMPRAKVDVQQIGNGEHVVVVNYIMLWSPQDWQANRAKITGKAASVLVEVGE